MHMQQRSQLIDTYNVRTSILHVMESMQKKNQTRERLHRAHFFTLFQIVIPTDDNPFFRRLYHQNEATTLSLELS